MDGTFVNNKKEFSPEFKDIFYQLKKKNILFCAASGRQYYSLYEDFKPMSEDMLFIAENGGFVAYGKECLKAYAIEKETLNQLLDMLSQIETLMIVPCGKLGAYPLLKDKQYEFEIKKYYHSYKFIKQFSDIDDEIVKVAIYDPEYKIGRFVDIIQSNLPKGLKQVTSGFEWMDITNADVTKGNGMKLFQEKLNISKDGCAAFGDNLNDYELLTSVKYSYAMSNAVQPIKDIAYEVIGSNEEFGVITKIKEILQEQ